jgi:multiple sugar transport system permease protein
MKRTAWNGLVGFYVPILIAAVGLLFPFYWLVATAMKTPEEAFRIPPTWYPHELTLRGFREVFTGGAFSAALWNSFFVAVITSLLAVAIGLCGGYALARLRSRWRQTAGLGLIFSQLFPAAAILIPLSVFWSKVGLHASYTALIITYLAQAVPIATWLLKGYLETVPREMEEQAWIDGAGRGRAFFSVVLPLSLPAIGATAMLAFIHAWNEFLFALTLTGTDPQKKTLPVALVDFIGQHGIEWDKLMAASVVACVPPVALFLLAQRFFVSGLTSGAVKG